MKGAEPHCSGLRLGGGGQARMIRCGGGGFEAFVFIDPGDRDLEAVVVRAGDKGAFFEVPEGEFEVFAGHAETVFEVEDGHRGGGGFKEAAVIESGEEEVAFPAFSIR